MAESIPPKRVLIADDDLLIGTSLKRACDFWAKNRGIAVLTETYADGSEALAATHRAPPPSLIVSDTHMPRLDGINLLRGVRATFPDLPFVLVSGKGLTAVEEAERRRLKAEFFEKPMALRTIEGFLDRLLNAPAKRLAVVTDDEPLARESLSDFLTHLGFEVLEARDGTETLAYCRSRAVDFVISDFQMGDLDGVRCLIQLRKEDRLMPYLVLSGRTDPDIVTIITQNGGNFRQKPLDNDGVKEWLRGHAFLPDAS